MAALNQVFDATQVDPSESFDVIPAGKYTGQILQSDLRATKAGDGQYIWLEHEITDGEYKGRKLWGILNIVNPSPKAAEMGNRQLSALCHAVGELSVNDTEQLHFKLVTLVVKVRPASGDFPAKNEIGNYEPVTQHARPVAAAVRPSAPPIARPAAPAAARPVAPPPAATAKAPWHSARA